MPRPLVISLRETPAPQEAPRLPATPKAIAIYRWATAHRKREKAEREAIRRDRLHREYADAYAKGNRDRAIARLARLRNEEAAAEEAARAYVTPNATPPPEHEWLNATRPPAHTRKAPPKRQTTPAPLGAPAPSLSSSARIPAPQIRAPRRPIAPAPIHVARAPTK